MHRVAVAAAVVLAVGTVAGLAIADPLAPGPEPQSDRRPLISDEGSYAGLGIGDSVRSVSRRFDDCQTGTGATTPLAYDFLTENAGPTVGAPPGDKEQLNVRCQLASFLAYDQVFAVYVVDPAAETPRGIGRGDSLTEARDAYPEVRCTVQNEGTEYGTFPQCYGRLRGGPGVWFGGDPVRMIAYSRTPFLCGGECPAWP